MNSNLDNEILLNKMYVGEYISEKSDNIGHEIINLYRDDNGNNYIYVLGYGVIEKSHNNKIDTILLVRNIGKNKIEILAKAEGLEQIIKLKSSYDSEKESVHNEQIKYIRDNMITYAGVPLDVIFDNNYNDKLASYITFKADKVVKPIRQIIISQPLKFHQKMYISQNKNQTLYNELKQIIDNESLWGEKNKKFSYTKQKANNFLKIIKKENDEVIFSNLLQYYLSINKQAFCSFVKDVLNITNFSQNCLIEREKDNIDLFISDENNYVVIENKIKSSVNGEKYNPYTKDYTNQLIKYYELTQKYDKENKIKKYFYIFHPNYNVINKEELKKKCSKQENKNIIEQYNFISYKTLYDFFNKDEIRESYYDLNIPYYYDFLDALSNHASYVNNTLEKEMHRRLNMTIAQIINNSNK